MDRRERKGGCALKYVLEIVVVDLEKTLNPVIKSLFEPCLCY